MTQKKSTTLILALSVTLLFLASFTVMSVRAPASGPYYTLGASPSTINEEEGNVRITFTITGGTANTAYTFQFTVTKPGGAGQAYVDESFPTNSTGGYTQVLTYPGNNPVWNPVTGTAQTDLPGNYTVTVVETAPKSVTTGFPSAKFTVTSVLTVRLVTPTQGSTIQRGTTANFAATVDDVNGQPLTDAQVSVSTPGGGQVGLTPTTPIGTYSASYQVQRSDPLGAWNITATAYSPIPSTTNNFGAYSITVTISPSQLIVSSLSTYNQYGTPTGDFSLGDTLYASFTVAYPTGGYLTTGSFIVHVEDPTGTFDDLFKLTGGEMQPPATLMIVSDSGAGSTTMALQLLYRDLSRGKFCSLLSYDAFPAEVSRRMRDMGWDIAEYLKTGQLKILDCYSALAGVEGSLIKDPTDFTEVSIQVTGMIEKAKGPVTTLLDSVTPIFNSAAAKDCINFLQVIGAKIKNSGGIFILTVTKGSIPEDVRSKIESMADGVIELNLIKKSNSLRRALQVKKMAGRQTSPVETGFEIVH